MGREIRRVPKDWNHPRDEKGKYRPLFDKTYKDAAEEWIDEFMKWANNEYPAMKSNDIYYWDGEGNPPDEEYYRIPFASESTHYQIYETVSEGTPVSPIFETEKEIVVWLIDKGYSPKASAKFVEVKWCMSGLMTNSKYYKNIEAFDAT